MSAPHLAAEVPPDPPGRFSTITLARTHRSLAEISRVNCRRAAGMKGTIDALLMRRREND